MSKAPDFDVSCKKKGEKYSRRVGAAWKITNRDGESTGGIGISLDVPLMLSDEWQLTLWPRDEERGKKSSEDLPRGGFDDDDIPF